MGPQCPHPCTHCTPHSTLTLCISSLMRGPPSNTARYKAGEGKGQLSSPGEENPLPWLKMQHSQPSCHPALPTGTESCSSLISTLGDPELGGALAPVCPLAEMPSLRARNPRSQVPTNPGNPRFCPLGRDGDPCFLCPLPLPLQETRPLPPQTLTLHGLPPCLPPEAKGDRSGGGQRPPPLCSLHLHSGLT